MKTIAGIICRRLLTLTLLLGCSVVVCSGVNKHALNIKSCGYNNKEINSVKECFETVQPSELVSIRILQLI